MNLDSAQRSGAPSVDAPELPTWQPPPIIDEFQVLRPLGQGAMGLVYLGHDTLLDRQVAVKFIAAFQPDQRSRQLFLNEARAIARLQHPNVVTIYRVGEVDGRPFLVSELVRGVSLNEVDKPVPWTRALDMAIGAARGLAAAHRHGVLHRDIKPANMMLTTDGQVKLLDFGLATFADAMASTPEGAPPMRPEEGPARRLSLPPQRPPGHAPAEAVVGTPLYMAPEVRRGQPATRRSDIYSLGCALFELCTGHAPLLVALSGSHRTVVELADRTQDDTGEDELDPQGQDLPQAPSLLGLVTGIDTAFAGIVDRCLQSDPELRFASGEELWDALDALHAAVPVGRPPPGNPYRGLLPFDEEHRALFFGRGAETRVVLERLRTEPLLILAGGSGTGKTSLCRAGVLPLCAEGALGEGQRWTTVRLTPGRQPLRALAATLAPLVDQQEEDLAATLALDPPSLARVLRRRERGAAVLLFIDQLEELFTLAPPAEAAALGEVLGAFDLQGPSVRVLLAIRADFLPRLLSLAGIGAVVSRALHLLRPLSPEGVREAVVGPARRCGVRFESESLVASLVESTQETAGGLSLLQFALAELWEARDPTAPVITEAALKALGGGMGALARHGDQVLSRLDEDGRNQARRIFSGLVDRDGRLLRRPRAALCPDNDGTGGAVLEALVRGRLVVASESAGETSYEIAHEALLLQWGTLREWLDQSAESRAARRRIEAAAEEWDRLGRPAEALWQERQLLDVTQVHEVDLWPREVAFLHDARRALRRRRLRRQGALVGLPLLLLLGYGGMRLMAQRALDRAVGDHVARAMPALRTGRQAQEAGLLRRSAVLALFDQGQTAAAEESWTDVQVKLTQADQGYATAGQELEAALILDTRRRDTRRLIAEATYGRALLLEEMGRLGQQEDLLRRLATFDETGEWRGKLVATAHIEVDTRPQGAPVRLYRAGERGFHLERDLGCTPLRVDISQGSWLLSFAQQGAGPAPAELGAAVPGERARMPILLSRGERRSLSVYLPDEREIPPGYVYVPAGDFLYGSADDEALRRGFFHAQPMHRVHTEGFLIGRTEVTFAQWLAFLRDLPEAERRRHTPQGSNLHGHLLLRELPDGTYQLNFRPVSMDYSAAEGEPIRYGERAQRKEQDWLRMPVSAISWDDAQAYAGWLDRTGRLRGARLCDEREWERAARGADGRHYPHGERLLPDDADFDETYQRRPLGFGPDEVGSHPASQSPFGVLDMAGNVWELTHQAGEDRRTVLRGGGWYYDQLTNSTVNREPRDKLPAGDIVLGLRLCAPAPALPSAETTR